MLGFGSAGAKEKNRQPSEREPLTEAASNQAAQFRSLLNGFAHSSGRIQVFNAP
jgi:hypothetical protein